MATIKASPTFEGIPQELRDKIYPEVISSSPEHVFTVRAVPSPKLGSIFALDHPCQRINRKILRDFEKVAIGQARMLRMIVMDLDFGVVKKFLGRHPQASIFDDLSGLGCYGCHGWRMRGGLTRGLIIHLKCTRTFMAMSTKDIVGALESMLRSWVQHCDRNSSLKCAMYHIDASFTYATVVAFRDAIVKTEGLRACSRQHALSSLLDTLESLMLEARRKQEGGVLMQFGHGYHVTAHP